MCDLSEVVSTLCGHFTTNVRPLRGRYAVSRKCKASQRFSSSSAFLRSHYSTSERCKVCRKFPNRIGTTPEGSHIENQKVNLENNLNPITSIKLVKTENGGSGFLLKTALCNSLGDISPLPGPLAGQAGESWAATTESNVINLAAHSGARRGGKRWPRCFLLSEAFS